MSATMSKLRKQLCFTIDVCGEPVHVRPLNQGELARAETLSPDDKTGFLFACALLSDDGSSPEHPQAPGESDHDWSQRVARAFDDVPTVKIMALIEGIRNLGKVPKVADIAKN